MRGALKCSALDESWMKYSKEGWPPATQNVSLRRQQYLLALKKVLYYYYNHYYDYYGECLYENSNDNSFFNYSKK